MAATVVAFCGLPGSGKSTLARALEQATGWQRLDRDALRLELFAQGGYTANDKRLLADAMLERLRERLQHDVSVILDGMTFSQAAERKRFANAAAAVDACWQAVWLDCDPATARARVMADIHHLAADRKPGLVDIVAARFEPPRDAIRLPAALSPDEQLQRLLAALQREVPDAT